MNATLLIPEKNMSIDLENVDYSSFKMIHKHNNDIFLEYKPVDEPITIITSNMPEELKKEIHDLVSRYCYP